MVAPQAKKKCVEAMVSDHGLTQRQACKLVGACRGTVRYTACVRAEILKIAHERSRFGYRRIQMVLERDGLIVNHKKVFRIYQDLQIKVRRRSARKRPWEQEKKFLSLTLLMSAGP